MSPSSTSRAGGLGERRQLGQRVLGVLRRALGPDADEDDALEAQLAVLDLGDVLQLGGQTGDPAQRLAVGEVELLAVEPVDRCRQARTVGGLGVWVRRRPQSSRAVQHRRWLSHPPQSRTRAAFRHPGLRSRPRPPLAHLLSAAPSSSTRRWPPPRPGPVGRRDELGGELLGSTRSAAARRRPRDRAPASRRTGRSRRRPARRRAWPPAG